MLVTHAGNLLLLADAVKRGLYTGDAEKFYRDGVTAAMKQFSYYEKASATITDDAITAYLNANHWMLIRKKRWNRLIRNIISIRSVMSMKLLQIGVVLDIPN